MSPSPTLSRQAKQLSAATGAKHTTCLRILGATATRVADPAARLEIAREVLVAETDTATGLIGASAPTEEPHFDFDTWWSTGRHLGVYGPSGAGKTVLTQHLAATLMARGVEAWAIDFNSGAQSSWSGLVRSCAGHHDLTEVRALLQEAAQTCGDRVLFIEGLAFLAAESGAPEGDTMLRETARKVRELLEDTPVGLRIVGTSYTATRARGPALAALIEIGDKVMLGPVAPGQAMSLGAPQNAGAPQGPGHGIWISAHSHGIVTPVPRHSPFHAVRDWDDLYGPRRARSSQVPRCAPAHRIPLLQVGDRLRFWRVPRTVWEVRAVALKLGQAPGAEHPVVVATSHMFGESWYLALDCWRGLRSQHDLWGDPVVSDDDCQHIAEALADGAIDFFDYTATRLDLHTIERDGQVIWADEH